MLVVKHHLFAVKKNKYAYNAKKNYRFETQSISESLLRPKRYVKVKSQVVLGFAQNQ